MTPFYSPFLNFAYFTLNNVRYILLFYTTFFLFIEWHTIFFLDIYQLSSHRYLSKKVLSCTTAASCLPWHQHDNLLMFCWTFSKGQKFSNLFIFRLMRTFFEREFRPSQLKHHLHCLTFVLTSKWHRLLRKICC